MDQVSLEDVDARQASALRTWLEQARAAAGLDLAVPERAENVRDTAARRNLVAGDVKFELTLTVDSGEPVSVTVLRRQPRSSARVRAAADPSELFADPRRAP